MAKTYPKKAGYACGGKVKGHADGGMLGKIRGAAENVVRKMTEPKKAEPAEAPAPAPAPKEIAPTPGVLGSGAAAKAGTAIQERWRRNAEVGKE